jgi:hypothetical protein
MAAAVVKPPGPTMQPTQKPAAPVKPQREPGAAPKRNGRLATWLRVIISIWIVWHFAGVFLAAMCIPATSDLVNNIAQQPPMQWYLDGLYLNQGHSFFAPDVGPSHVIHYELFDQSNRPMGEGDLPSLKDEWPRLRYHRHFMLADQAPAGDDNFSKYWGRVHLEAYARQVLRDHPDAQAIRLRHYAHWPLTRELELKARKPEYGRERAYYDFVQEMRRDGVTVDERGYQLLGEVTQRRSDLGPEETIQSNAWQSGPVNTAGRWQGGPR